MKLFRFLPIVVFAFGASAAEHNTKCKDELKRLCGAQYPGGRHLGQCIKLGIDRLSPECRPRHVDFTAIRRDCGAEISAACSGSTDDGKIYQCLRRRITETPETITGACLARMK